MKFNVLGVVLFVAGFVLVYAGVKDVDPRDVVKAALRGKNPGELSPIGTTVTGGGAAQVTPIPNAGPTTGHATRGDTSSPSPHDPDLTPDTGGQASV